MTKSKLYHVVWEIAVYADSPIDAAKQALEMQRDKDSTATMFDVTAGDIVKPIRIDLEEVESQ